MSQVAYFSVAVASGDTTVTIRAQDLVGFKSGLSYPFLVWASHRNGSQGEYMTATADDGTSVITVTRGMHGTAPTTFAVNDGIAFSVAPAPLATVNENALTLSDVTTLNASTTKHGFLPKLPNDATKYPDGAGNWSVPPGGAFSPIVRFATIFETIGSRFNTALGGIGTVAVSNTLVLTAGAGGGGYATLYAIPQNGVIVYTGSPLFGMSVLAVSITSGSGDGDAFFGLGAPTCGNTGITYTDRHIGFKFVKSAGGTVSLYATQGDGSTETASAALTTVADSDSFRFCVKVNSTTSVDYYYSKNGGVWSSATNLASHQPTTTDQMFSLNTTNHNVANQFQFWVDSFFYER